jgi:single-strand DNA-binding protein
MSQSLASITLVGRLTRDAELKYTNSGQPVCSFSIATDDRVKRGDQWIDEPSYWDVDLWGKRGESVNQYLTKGKLVAVAGSARIDRWQTDGAWHQKVRVNANDVQLLGSKEGQGEARQGQDDNRPAERPARAPAPRQPANQAGQGEAFTDDIPF